MAGVKSTEKNILKYYGAQEAKAFHASVAKFLNEKGNAKTKMSRTDRTEFNAIMSTQLTRLQPHLDKEQRIKDAKMHAIKVRKITGRSATASIKRAHVALKKTKAVAYKSVYNTVEAYKRNVPAGKEAQSDLMDKMEKELSKYLTKKGKIRAGLSNKKIREFNALVKEFKQSPQSSTSFRRQAFEDKRHENIMAHSADKKSGLLADKLFEDKLMQVLLKSGAIGYEVIYEMADKYNEYSLNDIVKAVAPVAQRLGQMEGYEDVLKTVQEYRNLNLPESSQRYVDQDDFNRDLKQKLKEMSMK